MMNSMIIRNRARIGLFVAALCLGFLVFPITAQADDYYVATTGTNDPGGGSAGNPWKTITYALSQVSGSGHTIHVAAGTYDTALGETFPLNMKNGVSLQGDGAATTIVDANDTAGVISASSIASPTTLDGFTITNGSSSGYIGAGIHSTGGTWAVSNCIMTSNTTTGAGGGMYCEVYDYTTYTNCSFTYNSAGGGGGVYVYYRSAPTFNNCVISNNSASSGGAIFTESIGTTYGYPTFINCTITDNSATTRGGAMATFSGPGLFYNCTIAGNSAPSGSALSGLNTGATKLINSIIWGNTGATYEIQRGSTSWPFTITDLSYSDFNPSNIEPEVGWSGSNNINSDPLFVGGGDYHLQGTPTPSPCIDAGTDDTVTYPNIPSDDIDGDSRPQGAYDMGSDEYVAAGPTCSDGDGDGYGDPGDPSCPGGPETDCDDGDDTIYPGATEVYCDGIDQDCSGADDCDAGHFTHTGSTAKGPDALACTDCHIDDTPELGEDFADGQPFAATAVCDICHSPGGEFDGVDDATIGAKANWPDGVYEADGETLSSGKEQWCGTCHDDEAASSRPGPSVELIVDNPDATFVSSWGTSASGGYNGDYRWHAAGIGSCTATWTPNLPSADTYNVYAYWKNSPNRATDSPYTIYYDGGSETIDVNQQINGYQWNLLGTYPFAAGTSGSVVLSDDANQYVIADAVKFDNGSGEAVTSAPNVTGDNATHGFYVTGHNIDCLSCHDAGKEHIDHAHRTYVAGVNPYGDSYRLKVPSTKPTRYLCFGCHNSTEVLGQNSLDVSHTNFWNNDSYVENSHAIHLGFTGIHFDSDWDGVVDSTESCITCHNVHGSPTEAMIRHGELISTYGTTDKVPALNFSYLGSATLVGSTGGRMNYAGPGVGQNGVCWACHSAISYSRTPYLGPKVMPLPVDDPVANDGSGTATITVFVSDADGDVSSVEIDLTPISGSANQAMNDDGGGYYSYLVTIPATTPDSPLTFEITATDLATNSGEGEVTLIVVDPDSIYVDNADAALVCDWGISPSGGYRGDYYWHAAGTGSCTATWTPDVPSVETYNVYAWWKASSNRATNAKYTIYHESGSQTVEVNQEIGGSQWNYLGNFSFAAGTSGYVVLSDDANEYVVADAIKLTPSAPPPPETVIVDNPNAQFVCYWGRSSTGGYIDDYRWHAAGSGSCTATWTPNLVAGASYSVYAWWKASPNRATDAPYTIYYDGGSTTVDVNQEINGNQWNLLGTYQFAAGQSGYVVLSDDANQYVIADAVKFEP